MDVRRFYSDMNESLFSDNSRASSYYGTRLSENEREHWRDLENRHSRQYSEMNYYRDRSVPGERDYLSDERDRMVIKEEFFPYPMDRSDMSITPTCSTRGLLSTPNINRESWPDTVKNRMVRKKRIRYRNRSVRNKRELWSDEDDKINRKEQLSAQLTNSDRSGLLPIPRRSDKSEKMDRKEPFPAQPMDSDKRGLLPTPRESDEGDKMKRKEQFPAHPMDNDKCSLLPTPRWDDEDDNLNRKKQFPAQPMDNDRCSLLPIPQSMNNDRCGLLPIPQPKDSDRCGLLPIPQSMGIDRCGLLPTPHWSDENGKVTRKKQLPVDPMNSDRCGLLPIPHWNDEGDKKKRIDQFIDSDRCGLLPTPRKSNGSDKMERKEQPLAQPIDSDKCGLLPTPRGKDEGDKLNRKGQLPAQPNDSSKCGLLPTPCRNDIGNKMNKKEQLPTQPTDNNRCPLLPTPSKSNEGDKMKRKEQLPVQSMVNDRCSQLPKSRSGKKAKKIIRKKQLSAQPRNSDRCGLVSISRKSVKSIKKKRKMQFSAQAMNSDRCDLQSVTSHRMTDAINIPDINREHWYDSMLNEDQRRDCKRFRYRDRSILDERDCLSDEDGNILRQKQFLSQSIQQYSHFSVYDETLTDYLSMDDNRDNMSTKSTYNVRDPMTIDRKYWHDHMQSRDQSPDNEMNQYRDNNLSYKRNCLSGEGDKIMNAVQLLAQLIQLSSSSDSRLNLENKDESLYGGRLHGNYIQAEDDQYDYEFNQVARHQKKDYYRQPISPHLHDPGENEAHKWNSDVDRLCPVNTDGSNDKDYRMIRRAARTISRSSSCSDDYPVSAHSFKDNDKQMMLINNERINSSVNSYSFRTATGENMSSMDRTINYHYYEMMDRQEDISSYPVKEVIHLTKCVLYPPNPDIPLNIPKIKPLGCKTVFVAGLPPKTNLEIAKEIFERCGPVERIRLSETNICHIQFSEEISVENAINLNGYEIKIGNKDKATYTGMLMVDYEKSSWNYWNKQSGVSQQSPKHLQENYRPPVEVGCNRKEASLVCENLKSEETFLQAASILISWFEKGECSKKTCGMFFNMIQSTQSYVKKLKNEKNNYEKELNKAKEMFKEQFIGIISLFIEIIKIYKAASLQNCWDHFSNAQKKCIEMWKKQTEMLKKSYIEEIIKKEENEESKQRVLQYFAQLQEQHDPRSTALPVVHYTNYEASVVCEKLKYKETFLQGASILNSWLERGECSNQNLDVFYYMIQSTYNYVLELQVDKVRYEEQLNDVKSALKKQLEGIMQKITVVEKIYKVVSMQKCWDNFSKLQRKNIEMWKKEAEKLKNDLTEKVINEREDEEMDLSDDDSVADEKESDVKLMKRQYEEYIQKLQEELKHKDNELSVIRTALHNSKTEMLNLIQKHSKGEAETGLNDGEAGPIKKETDVVELRNQEYEKRLQKLKEELEHKDSVLSIIGTVLKNSKKEFLNLIQKHSKDEVELKELRAFKLRMIGKQNKDSDVTCVNDDSDSSPTPKLRIENSDETSVNDVANSSQRPKLDNEAKINQEKK